jgi:glucose dehydrogenase
MNGPEREVRGTILIPGVDMGKSLKVTGFYGYTTIAFLVVSPLLLVAMALSDSFAQAPAPDAGVANLPPGPGRDVFVKSCSQCHALGMSTGKHRPPEEWRAIIQEMIGRGAQLDADQSATIQKYLAANFSAPASPLTEEIAGSSNQPAPVLYPRPQGPNQWPAYGGGNANINYSQLTQITPQNVSELKQAWVYHYGAGKLQQGDQGLDYRFEVTPLIIGGVMYLSTPSSPAKPDLKSSIAAIEPETGRLIWKWESPLNIHGRGVAYWPGDANTAPRLIFASDGGLIMAVDVTTGKLARGFGRGGRIDAYEGVSDEIVGESRRSSYTVPNPVIVYKDLFITGARPTELGPPAPRGDIRAFSARTGRLVWDFHTVPQPGEPHHDEYLDDQWRDLSGANVWSSMALDDQAGILYAPTGDLNGYAAGPQLYSSSLLAIDANTGKLKWFHQITHHDIWDWDSPTPQVLIDVRQNGKTIPAVALTGKHSLFFMFDRRTGAPLNGFTEKTTPQPPTPSPTVWPTQPFPDAGAPGPLARIQMTRDEIPDLVPGMRAACQATWDENHTVSEPLYAPRQSPDHAVITYPGSTGGPNWGGASYNPDLHLYIVNVQNRVTFRPAMAPGTAVDGAGPGGMPHSSMDEDASPTSPRNMRFRGGPRTQPFSFTTPDGVSLSCGALPWGELIAVDVDAKRIIWRAPLGVTEDIGPVGENTGTANLGGSMTTQSGLLFIGATNDRRFRAFDAKTGKKLWETTLDASGAATPVTFMGKDGKQYVVIAAGGGTSVGRKVMSDDVVAFRLP